MTRYSGEDLYVTFQGVVLSGLFRSIETAQAQGDIDATVAADTVEQTLPGKITQGVSLGILAEAGTTGTAIYANLAAGQEGTLVFFPEGTAVAGSNTTHTINEARVNGRNHVLTYDAVVELAADFICNTVEVVTANA